MPERVVGAVTVDEARQFFAAVRKVLEGFDAGVFVRDTSHDHESGWAMRQLPYLVALGAVTRAMEPEPALEGRDARTEAP